MEELVEQLTQAIESIGYFVYDIKQRTQDDQRILSIEIENDTTITIDDCVLVSNHLSPILDALDPFNEPYSLEVASPGAERVLNTKPQMHRAIGKKVHIETLEGTYDGILTDVTETQITLKNTQQKLNRFLLADITLIRLAIDFRRK